ncbi:2-dehydropantoate 2-reductase [Aerophototrophica crusticola]|uniref:2-dehydropantoate 2-reductase n=1 Tax=Aerophototrophica crusticola TaxID=1709002 RepID=A0A858RAI0_9PROT|nr:2-dehydropantoate 2-reductase [Rhodospirillaceae bacterium B3]
MASFQRITIAGAGSIGGYVGGCLALAGRPVTFLLRPRLRDVLAADGLRVTDYEGWDRTLPPDRLSLETDPAAALAGADLVLVTVKSGATAEMAALVAAHAPPGAVVASLQNGVGNAEILRQALPSRRVVAGMVPFNVVQLPGGRFHRGTEGAMLVEAGIPGLLETLRVDGLPVGEHPDMPAVLWGKLLVNLNNALNALSGLPLVQQLGDRRWRRILAAQQSEALAALKRARIKPARLGKVVPGLLPHILRLPDPLFRRVAKAMLTIDPQARSSMWEDLSQGRKTEIDYLQGAVVALAERHGLDAPTNRRVLALVKQAEAAGKGSPGLGPEAL